MASKKSLSDILVQACTALTEPNAKFSPGDIVTWKNPILVHNAAPALGSIGIVTKVYETPMYNSSSTSGSPHYREPEDLVLAIVVPNTPTEDPVIGEFHYDSRRFRLATPEEIEAANALFLLDSMNITSSH